MPKKTKTEHAKNICISISFTKDEIDWLGWVMKDVIGKTKLTATQKKAKSKVLQGVKLINDTLAMGLPTYT